jgi:uncharacterized delta-60 repeat protein
LKTASGSRHIQQLESRTLLSLAGPDPSFGAGGTVDVPAHGQIAFLPNGKILTIGSVVKTVDDDNEFMTVVSRLNADGTKDLTFGTSGSISYPGPDGYATIVRDRYFINGDGYTFDGVAAGGLPGGTDLDALPDGGFLITSFSNSKEYLTKFDVHEKQDVLFGTNGRVDVTPTQQGQSQQLAVISPNGILVASVDSKSVQRYTFAGKLDTTFGTNGTATFGFELGHLLPQSDGKIVVVSDVVVKVPHMIRLNADGSLDATFGTSGTVNLVDRVGQPLHLKNALLDPQDRIVITAGLGDPGIYRYSPSGAPEHAPYNGTLTASNGLRLTADTIAADANGRILIGNLANLTRLDIVKPMVIGRDHVLYISGATGNDHIAVTAGTSGKIKITLNGSTIDQSTSGIVGININGSEGNNTIDYTLALPVTIRAGGGNDCQRLGQ